MEALFSLLHPPAYLYCIFVVFLKYARKWISLCVGKIRKSGLKASETPDQGERRTELTDIKGDLNLTYSLVVYFLIKNI